MPMFSVSGTDNSIQSHSTDAEFRYFVEKFDDIQILKYQVRDFDQLTLRQKTLIYYLSEAALSGRDILWDQNFRFNLRIRKMLEAIISSYKGDRETADYKSFITYSKKVFFANGIHHHYSNDKLIPGFPESYLTELIMGSDPSLFPLGKNETPGNLVDIMKPVLFNPSVFARKIESRHGADIISESATNLYENVTQKEAEEFYAGKTDLNDPHHVSLGLNSKLLKRNGKVIEEVYRSGGLYGKAIDSIIFWLEKAISVAETEMQKNGFRLLIEYYRSGDLKKWDEYNVVWAKDTDIEVDYNNGFIESYGDPLGMKATWESIVNFKDSEGTRRTEIITAFAQWFEDHSPIDQKYKKGKVKGIAAKVINIAMLGGDCYPAAPLGINLPNADWIRKEVGSKSVTLANIARAYDEVSKSTGFLDEFAADQVEAERSRKFSCIASLLHTDLHECVGHGSGKLAEGTDPNSLKNYASTLEEARADLFALYFMMDEKMLELSLLPDKDAARAEYDSFVRNGLLTQLVRIKPGKDIEEAHMRDRAMISHWVYEKGKTGNVIEIFKKESKTFVRINDYVKLQELFGQLLKEVQRIKSEGDFEAGRRLVETYGVKVDPELHKELLDRYEKLNLAPYSGFVNPKLLPVKDNQGEIIDVKVLYTDDYLAQMMEYGSDYSFLLCVTL